MRYSKKIVGVLLAVAVIFGIAGCAKTQPLTRDGLISELEAYGVEKLDKIDILIASMSRRSAGEGYYVAEDKDKAKELSNIVLNRFGHMPELDATGFVLTVVNEEGSEDKHYNTSLVYMTFDNERDAEKAYDNLVDAYGDPEDGKTGTKSSITYCIDSCVSAAGHNKIGTGIYLQEKAVVFMRADAAVKDKFKFADTICGKFGLPALPKAS